MYVGTLFVYGIILVLASPVIWIAWWLIADLGERISGAAAVRHDAWAKPTGRAA